MSYISSRLLLSDFVVLGHSKISVKFCLEFIFQSIGRNYFFFRISVGIDECVSVNSETYAVVASV